jgi:hypothetical protein
MFNECLHCRFSVVFRYVLQRHIPRDQLLFPFDSRPIGFFKGEPVYARHQLKAVELLSPLLPACAHLVAFRSVNAASSGLKKGVKSRTESSQ